MNKRILIIAALSIFFITSAAQAQWFSWEARTGLEGEQLASLGANMLKRGYAPNKINSVVDQNTLKYSTIWVHDPDGHRWELKTRMTPAENQRQFDQMKADGYAPIDIAVTTANGAPVYSGIWRKNALANWQSWTDLTKDEVLARTQRYAAQGMDPIDINAFLSNGEVRYAGIWGDAGFDSSIYIVGVSEEEMMREFRTLPHGFVPYDLNILDVGGRLVFSAVFIKDGSMEFQATFGSDSGAFQSVFDKNVDAGFMLQSVNSYVHDGVTKYAGLFLRSKPTSTQQTPAYTLPTSSIVAANSSRILDIAPVRQQTKVWCWLAVGEMIFKHYGVRSLNTNGNYQCGIIGTVAANPCGGNCFQSSCIIPAGSNYNVVRMLKDYTWAASRKVFSASEGHELPFATIKANIDSDQPIIAGISPSRKQYYGGAEHVTVIVGYEVVAGEPFVFVNDPYPYSSAENPYTRLAAAKDLGNFRYRLPLRDFSQTIFWHWSISNIRIN